MVATAGCLGDDTIAAMLDGQLADASARDARVHIGTCDACRELVAAAIGAPPTAAASSASLAHAASELAPGAVFAGRYRIDRVLGEGGMGRVFAAHQLGLERRVAIKVLRPELACDAVALARFHREARLAASIDSTHVVRIYDLGVVETGEPYLVMELLDGEDLASIVARGPLSLDDATRHVAAACEALGEAHALGIVHRDIKPSNLFVTRAGRLVVLDFGLAKLTAVAAPQPASALMTRVGMILGSPRYIAPEQIVGASEVDHRADIWSLGATLYHLVTGAPPFPEPTLEATFARILGGTLPALDQLPTTIATTLARALSRDPAGRFATVGELALALRGKPDLDDRFEILELLGEGSHGTVFRARHNSGGREVALKILRGDAHGIRDRFAREAAIVQRLEHPNTVRLYESSLAANDTPFMVFELVRGRTLASELHRGPLLPARVARIATQLLKALLEAHALGIVHRDVTPSNILLVDYAGDPDFVKLLDFGVAADVESPRLTMTGQTLGTPRYMAPEQVLGARVDGRADLYALGLVMAEALTGTPVFDGDSAMAVCMAQVSEVPAPLPYAVTAGPFGETIARATAKRAADRFASAAEMLAAIERGPSAHVTVIPSPRPPDVVVTKQPRARVQVALIASTAVLGVTTLLLAWRPWSHAPDDPPRPIAAAGSDRGEAASWFAEPTRDAVTPEPGPAPPAPASAGNLDEARLRARLAKLGWPPIEITREDFPGCHHTRLRMDAGTFANQPRSSGSLTLLACDSASYAASEAARLRRGFSDHWVVLDGNLVLLAAMPEPNGAFPTEAASKQLADAVLAP